MSVDAKRVECFLIVPSRFARESLRRYVSRDEKCSGPGGYHDARVILGEVGADRLPPGCLGDGRGEHDRSDPCWPVKCDGCDYHFTDADEWQHNLDLLWERADGADTARFTLREPPPGAMWFMDAEVSTHVGPDGKALHVMLPDGRDWHVDHPASNSQTPWTRTGVAPRITARPSILTPKYHGFLTDGVLEEC